MRSVPRGTPHSNIVTRKNRLTARRAGARPWQSSGYRWCTCRARSGDVGGIIAAPPVLPPTRVHGQAKEHKAIGARKPICASSEDADERRCATHHVIAQEGELAAFMMSPTGRRRAAPTDEREAAPNVATMTERGHFVPGGKNGSRRTRRGPRKVKSYPRDRAAAEAVMTKAICTIAAFQPLGSCRRSGQGCILQEWPGRQEGLVNALLGLRDQFDSETHRPSG